MLDGLLFGLCIYVRPVILWLPLLLIVPLITRSRFFMISIILVLLPWSIHNYVQYGSMQLNTQTGHNALYCNASLLESSRTGRPLGEVQSDLMNDIHGISNPYKLSDCRLSYARSIIMAHPVDYALVHFRGMINMHLSPDTRTILTMMGIRPTIFRAGFTSTSAMMDKIRAYFSRSALEVALSLYLSGTSSILYVMSFIGCIYIIKHKQWFLLSILLITIGYFIAVTGPIGEPRLLLPVLPLYAILAGASGEKQWDLWRWR